MEFPFGHHHSHHHNREDRDRDREEEFYPPPPPNFSSGGGYSDGPAPPPNFIPGGGYRDGPPPPNFIPGGGYRDEPPPPNFNPGGGYRDDPPPPPFHSVTQHHHSAPPPNYGEEYRYNSPQPPHESDRFDSNPGYPPVQHVSHEVPHHSHHFPSFGHHHTHGHEGGGGGGPEIPNKPTVRIYTKADTNYSLTIRDGQVILAPADPRDDAQHWIKDERYSTRVKDKEGHPSFALVNKATGQAIKHSIGATQPVQLVSYNPNVFDESVLWTESKDLGDSYRCIRMVTDILLNFDAFHGDKNHGGVRDGTVAVLWEWKTGDNQRWKIVPY